MRSGAADGATGWVVGGIAVISASCGFIGSSYSPRILTRFSRLKHQHLILDRYAVIANPPQDRMNRNIIVWLARTPGEFSRATSRPICRFSSPPKLSYS